jgi:hypothetical protein
MSNTLLRLGLWIMILVLAAFVIDASYPDLPFAQLIEPSMLQQVLVLAAILVVAGIVLRVLGKGAKAVIKNRCQVCRTAIAPGAIYCRAHLRSILSDEDEKTHMTRVKR